mgnify:CR=1 FL=1
MVVVGHTDTLPIGPITGRKHPTNWHLSVHRAIAVMFTLKNYGVEYLRMGCMGYGEFRPRVPNPNRGGSEENPPRRNLPSSPARSMYPAWTRR